MIDEKSLGDEFSVLWAFESVHSLAIGALIFYLRGYKRVFPLSHPRGLLTNAEAAPSHVRLGITGFEAAAGDPSPSPSHPFVSGLKNGPAPGPDDLRCLGIECTCVPLSAWKYQLQSRAHIT